MHLLFTKTQTSDKISTSIRAVRKALEKEGYECKIIEDGKAPAIVADTSITLKRTKP